MTATACLPSAELSRAFSMGPDAALCAHLLECSRCRSEWESLTALRALGRELPYAAPTRAESAARRERLLLAAAASQDTLAPMRARRMTGMRAALVLGLAAAAGLVFLGGAWLGYSRGRTSTPATAFRGVVQPLGSASFAHQRHREDEWVQLSNGTVHVEVEHLSRGERFRVIMSDGEVEVRGTSFEVSAVHEHLTRVAVVQGRVEVRRPGHAALLLGPGEGWQAERAEPAESSRQPAKTVPAPPPPSSPSPALPLIATLREQPRAHPPRASAAASPTATPAERLFADGWSALRRSNFASAAAAFRQAVGAGAGEPILEDARFWLGVALARGGERDAAVRALRDFIAHHPAAARRGEAESILGWQLLHAGRSAEAAQLFRSAASDRSPDVQRSARAGLTAASQTAP